MHVPGCCIILLQPAFLMNSDSADSEADHSAARSFQWVHSPGGREERDDDKNFGHPPLTPNVEFFELPLYVYSFLVHLFLTLTNPTKKYTIRDGVPPSLTVFLAARAALYIHM